jgi:valyl-tRNA synthetase
MAAQGRDIKLAEPRIAGYRNFITKIWNASRFCQMNGCAIVPGFEPASVKGVLNKWIVAKTAEAAKTIADAIEAYRFNDAANGLYQFTWGAFCDWYLEFTKPVFTGSDAALQAETRATTAWVIDQILIIAQPMIPFVTQELWDKLAASAGITRPHRLINASWPKLDGLSAPEAEAEIDWVVDVISAIRSVRSEMGISPATLLAATVRGATAATSARLATHGDLITANARLNSIAVSDAAVAEAAQVVVGETTILLPLAGIIDLGKERDRLAKEIAKHENDIAAVVKKMSNEAFVAKAPAAVIQENRDRQATAESAIAKLKEALARLG